MMTTTKSLHFGKEVEGELSIRKNRSGRMLMEHKKNISRNYPAIEELRREISEISLDFADKIMASPKDADALESLARQMLDTKEAQLREMLVNNGFPADYLEFKYVCEVCRDTGVADGQMCGCVKQLVINDMFSGSGINRVECFENFRHDLLSVPKEQRAMERIFEYCVNYADSFPNNDVQDLMLIGAPGIGKTFLLNSIGFRVLENGHSVLKITANRLVNTVLDSISDKEKGRPDFVLPELLIIDDLGTEPMIPNITIETILSIICERQDMRKSTVIATNKDVGSLQEDYGDRVLSRLISPNFVKMIRINTSSVREIRI